MALFAIGFFPWCPAQSLNGVDAPEGGLLYFVNTTSDTVVVGACQNGNPGCSLRGAIQAANAHPGEDGIEMDLSTSDPNYNGIFWSIHLGSSLPDVTESVSINGPGAGKLVVRRNAAANFSIFPITTATFVAISGMTIRDGNAGGTYGGGIHMFSTGTLTVTNCALTNNAAEKGGGIYTNGMLILTNCTVSDNHAEFEGGGIVAGTLTATNCMVTGNTCQPNCPSNDGAAGGGLRIFGNATIKNCTINGNSVRGSCDGKSGDGGGIFVGGGTIDIINCCLGNNSAVLSISSALACGGGVYNFAANLRIANSTVSTNSCGTEGGGIYNNVGTLTVTNCTVSGNTTQAGGGIFNNTGDTANIKSSIIALNSGGTSPDLNGTFIAQGFNLIGRNNGAEGSFPAGNPNANNDIVGTTASSIDPKLDPNGLRNNGGSAPTIALQSDSPAIDKGTSNGSTGHLTTDQRGIGYARTIDNPGVPNAMGGDGTDTGAFEFGAKIPTVSRKTHGAAGTFDVDVAVGGVFGIECRSGGATGDHQVILTFPTPVTVSGSPQAQVTDGTGLVGTGGMSNGGAVTVSGSNVTVPLTNVANAQTITATVFGVSDGMNTNNINVPVRVLLADATGNGSVNASDVSQTKSRIGQAVTTSNFRSDVNRNGTINASDVSVVKSQAGTSIP